MKCQWIAQFYTNQISYLRQSLPIEHSRRENKSDLPHQKRTHHWAIICGHSFTATHLYVPSNPAYRKISKCSSISPNLEAVGPACKSVSLHCVKYKVLHRSTTLPQNRLQT